MPRAKRTRLSLIHSVMCAVAFFFATDIALAQQDSDTKKQAKSFAQKHKLEANGSLMLDLANVGGDLYTTSDRENEADVRRARIGFSGDISKRIDADITLDLNSDDAAVELHDLEIRYSHTKKHRVRLGLIKQPFGLENNTSSRKLATMERSMASRAFTPDRGYGIQYITTPDNQYLSVGAYADPDLDDVYDVSGRATYAPVNRKRSVLHFGLNAAHRENKSNRYRVRDSGVLQDGENFFRSGNYNPTEIRTLGIEAAWAVNSFVVQSEWFKQSLTLDSDESGNPDFTGGYVTFSLALNDGRRKYKNGEFSKVSTGKKGNAIELVASIGEIDTVFTDRGDRAREYVVGANYRLNDNIRFQGQVQHLSVTQDDGDRDTGNSVLLRLQIDFEAKANN